MVNLYKTYIYFNYGLLLVQLQLQFTETAPLERCLCILTILCAFLSLNAEKMRLGQTKTPIQRALHRARLWDQYGVRQAHNRLGLDYRLVDAHWGDVTAVVYTCVKLVSQPSRAVKTQGSSYR